ncbi:Keratin, type I cytoskeletal 18, partial [Galemys pyrenaicus]
MWRGIDIIQGRKETMQNLNNLLNSSLKRVRNLEPHNQESGTPGEGSDLCKFLDNSLIILKIDYAHLAAEDFRVKNAPVYEDHQQQLETIMEEILFIKKNHEDELTVEVNTPKSQDLCKTMADIQTQYDKLAQKNQVELDYSELGVTEMTLMELTHNLKARLRVVEACYGMQMQQLNGQHQTQKYEALLNIKIKLEAAITTYHNHRILENKVVSETSDTKALKLPKQQ